MIMKNLILFSIIAAMVICAAPVLAEDSAQPTPFTFLKDPTPPPQLPSLAERTTIDLRRDGDTYKDKETGEKYKVTEVGTTITIKNLQTGEKVKYRVSGETLTNKDTGQKLKIKRDGTNITITRKD